MNLETLQGYFQNIVLSEKSRSADWVSQREGRLPSKGRLDIYHNAYRIRLIEVLRENFEHTAIYLGDDWFNQLAKTYVEQHPSTYNNIGYYGDKFAEFLLKQLSEDKEVAELAELDWLLRRAFDGEDSGVLTMETLPLVVSRDPENFRLFPVPTVTLTKHTCNTLDIWHAIDQENAPPPVILLPQPVDVLVWRKGHSPHFRSVLAHEATALSWMKEGYSINEIGESLQNRFPDIDASTVFGQMLHRWINDEVLAD
ncbi:DUF2063 domain-containing protein [Veronia nyctiphanis]|uniref:DUF2063 domain-containing protein n=1 Tax=Veronia nyctiphanis TaxID=1278244 RepID=A0A4Q0YQ32_9GAMM|nr:putative DNA-binding domain-containing protein [Veronia nyctiphanis]RXJ72703.1 DUF2063 domain-containing protein [Veronia nyctiphanis]